MSKYKKIQREKLSGKSLEIYDKLKKASNNFENTEGKIGEALDKFYNKVEKTAVEVEKKVEPKKAAPKRSTAKKSTAKKSTKKKTTKKKTASKKPSYKNVNQGSYAKLASKIMKEKGISYKEAQKEASKIFAEEKKAKREAKAKSFSKSVTAFKKKYGGKGTKNTDIQKDADIPAKPVGKRVSKSGKVYYEYRDNRTDQKQPQPTDKPRLAKGGDIDGAKYLGVGEVKSVKLKNGDTVYNSIIGFDPTNDVSLKDAMDFRSGIHYSDRAVAKKDVESQYSLFSKGGKTKNWKYVKRYDIDYIVSDEDAKIKGDNLYSGLWMETNDYNKRFDKGGTIMSSDIKEKIFDENGERKIDKKSIEILTEYVNSLEQTKSANQKDGKYTPSRKKLHGKIIEKFKDGVVCIDNNKPIAILMGGSPASGKSTFLKKYAPYLLKDEILRIDADEVRAMLPEYEGWNASQTHLETKDIVNTLLSDRTIGLPCETDIIYDGTMNSNKSYLPLIKLLRKMDYKIFVVYIDKVPKDVIVDRALNRYKSSGRFVPLEVIDDFFDKGKDALNEIKKKVDGYMIVDGSGGNYKVIEEGGIKLPKTRKYGKIGSPMKKKMEFGGDIAKSYDVRPPYGTYAKGGKMKRDWSTYYNDGGMVQSKVDSLSKGDIIVITYDDSIANNNKVKLKVRSRNKVRKGTVDKITFNIYDKPNSVKFYAYNRGSKWGFAKGDLAIVVKSVESDVKMHDGGMVEGYDVRSPYGTYAKGGEVFFHDTKSNKLQEWERRKSKSGKKSFGAFAHRMNNKYIGDYYLYELDDFDKKMYSNIKLKDGEMLVRVETDNMVGGESPLVKINLKNGRVYFMSDSSDEKNPKFDRASADVIFMSVDKSMHKFAEGGTLPTGYHRMPDGEIMADSEHLAKGGHVCMSCGEYAKGGKISSGDVIKIDGKMYKITTVNKMSKDAMGNTTKEPIDTYEEVKTTKRKKRKR